MRYLDCSNFRETLGKQRAIRTTVMELTYGVGKSGSENVNGGLINGGDSEGTGRGRWQVSRQT